MKAQSNIKPNTIQDLGNNTYYFNYNVEFVNNMWMYDSILLKMPVSKDAIITALIREKYTLGDELSLNSKSMSIFLNTCTQEEKIRWTEQLKEFTAYRIECVRRAKEMYNMI